MAANPVDSSRVYLAAGLLSGASALFFNVLPVFVGALADAYGADPARLGDLVAVFNVGFTAAAVSAMLWIRRLPWVRVSSSAVIVATAALGAMSLARNLASVMPLAGVLGAAMGSLYALILAVLGQSSQPDRAFGIKLGLETVPGALLLFALPVLVAPRWGFDGVVIVMAITVALLGLATFGLPNAGSTPSRRVGIEAAAVNASMWPAMLALLSSLSFFTGIMAAWAFLELLADEKKLAKEAVGVILSTGFVLCGVGGFVAAAIGRRFGRVLPMAGIIALDWVALWLLADTSTVAGYAFGACALLFTVNFALAYSFGLTAEVDARGGFVVLSAAALSIGAIVGPGVGGRLIEVAGYETLLAFCALCSLVSLASYVVASRQAGDAPVTARD